MTAGFLRISRLILKRERFSAPVWIAGVVGVTLFFAGMFVTFFPDSAAVSGMAVALDTPAMTAMMGPVYGMEALTPMIVLSVQMRVWMMLAAAAMSIFLVIRHTRADEELGRLEMLRSLPVAKLTGAVAVFAHAAALNGSIALVTAAGLLVIHASGTTAAGAFAYAFTVATAGIAFAGIALLMAQLFSTARGALAASFVLLGLSYAMRASGDVSGSALGALSPLGLGLRAEPFYADNPVPILLLLLEGLAFFALALAFAARRDLGEGVLPARRGRGRAARWMLTPLGFSFRLVRSQILLWSVALFSIGAMYGSVMGDIESFTASNETYRQMLEATGSSHNLSESFIAMIFGIYAAIAVIPAMTHALKIRAEERRGRMDQLISKSVSRGAMLGSYALIAAVECALMQLVTTLGFYAAASASASVSLGMLIQAAMAYLPALWVMVGLCVFLTGALPRCAPLAWAVYAYAFVMLFFAKLVSLPEWAVRLSPFSNIPQLPVAQFKAMPLILLTAIGAALVYAGFRQFKRRDILSS